MGIVYPSKDNQRHHCMVPNFRGDKIVECHPGSFYENSFYGTRNSVSMPSQENFVNLILAYESQSMKNKNYTP